MYLDTDFSQISGGRSHYCCTVGCYPLHRHTSDMCHVKRRLPLATALPGWTFSNRLQTAIELGHAAGSHGDVEDASYQ